jgi:hypothetical protein
VHLWQQQDVLFAWDGYFKSVGSLLQASFSLL